MHLRNKLVLKNPPSIFKKQKHEFRVEDQYEDRALCRRIRYKNNWHPVFCQSATLNKLGKHIYLIGGVSHTIVQQVCYMTPSEGDYNWKIFKDKDATLQRYGHA